MLKDIFIDHNVAKNFSNPLDDEYKKLVKWLIRYDERSPLNNAYLAVSKKLLGEYCTSPGHPHSLTNIIIIIGTFTKQGRLNNIDNSAIKNFQRKYFKKHIVQRLRCNPPDRDHIPVVMLSDRKYALSRDTKFRYDVNNFPGFSALAAKCPQDIPYEQ